MTRSRAITNSTLLGLASGMRTFIAPATLAARGRLAGERGQKVLIALALGELAFDKHPAAPARIDPRGLGGRAVSAAVSGNVVAGRRGAVTAAAAAIAAAFACHRARASVVGTGVSDPVVAVIEDLLAVGIATAATRT